MNEKVIVRDREFTDVLDVTILDMEDGKVTRVEIEGMDGSFVKVSEEPNEEVVFEEDIAEVVQPEIIQPKDALLFDDGTEVRLLFGGGEWPLVGFENGEIYRVDSEGKWGTHSPDKVVRITDRITAVKGGFAKPEQLEIVEKVTEKEAELKVGDYAKFTDDEFEHRKGEIVKIVEIDDDLHLPYKLEELDGTHHGYASKGVLVKSTYVEAIEAYM